MNYFVVDVKFRWGCDNSMSVGKKVFQKYFYHHNEHTNKALLGIVIEVEKEKRYA
ncbi:hypothetical protein LX64_02336 [Chitinophaga skermanii]|uniref:Uncharacterized protein n=1 Tax=Chitinophaga skermanii TaxID=331697 RepID=A0A327QNF1_9BACT|nr:hypothetical protein LX64_02336 [Chitinophaga skermanii]